MAYAIVTYVAIALTVLAGDISMRSMMVVEAPFWVSLLRAGGWPVLLVMFLLEVCT